MWRRKKRESLLFSMLSSSTSCTQDEIWTHTPLPALPPQSSVSTNFTTCALWKGCPEQDSNLHASRHTHLKRARLPIPPPGPIHLLLERRAFIHFILLLYLFFRVFYRGYSDWRCYSSIKRERKTELESATPTLARLCSTNWATSAYVFCLSLSIDGRKDRAVFQTSKRSAIIFSREFWG